MSASCPRRRSSAVGNAAQKLAMGISAGVVGIIIGAFGFVSGAETQSATALVGIKVLTIYAPIAIAAILLALMCMYDLDDKLPQIRADLSARKSAI